MKYFLLVAYLLLSHSASAQQPVITGMVVDEQSVPLYGATIRLSNVDQVVQSDAYGNFSFKNILTGTYTIKVSFVGFKEYEEEILFNQKHKVYLTIQLQKNTTNLANAVIKGLEQSQALRQGTFNVTSLNAKLAYDQSATAGDVMNLTAGVVLRENGGLGSQTSYLINGLSGKQVKAFIDNIPIEYYGSAMSINVLPVNSIDHIGIYKGVVPVELSGDGLGGAIDVATNQQLKNRYEANYSIGSFNTHRALFDVKKLINSKNLAFGASGFASYSDNNYPIEVEIPNANGTPVPEKVKRFHDRYYNYRVESSLHLLQRIWADVFSVSASYSGINKQQQHGVQIGVPFGDLNSQEKHLLLVLRQQKYISAVTALETFAGYALTTTYYTDTTLQNYNWRGEISKFPRSVGGESSVSRNLLENTTHNIFFSALAKFQFSPTRLLTVNSFNAYSWGRGKDPIATAYYETDIFSLPTYQAKNIIGASLEQTFLHGRLTSITSGKFFNYKYSGFFISKGTSTVETAQQRFGANEALRLKIGGKGLLKASYEYSVRIPDAAELIGFVNIIKPNPALLPERSHNINFGGLLTLDKLEVDINSFYRQTKDMIFLQSSAFYAQYQNLLEAQIVGIEGTVNVKVFKNLSVKTDITYQDIRNRSNPADLNIVSNKYFNARVPNMPYLFGQGSLRYKIDTKQLNKWQLWYSAGYVHDFYLNWAIDGIAVTKASIPAQLKQNIGVSLSLKKQRINLIAECMNLFDQNNYSNYKVELPGRSLNLKIRFFNP